MGLSCSKEGESSPAVPLRKIFARWANRIFTQSGHTIKIADAEKRSRCKKRLSVSDPLFISSTISESGNHVTLLSEAPSVPPRKNKPRLAKKRVSFQSDIDIMNSLAKSENICLSRNNEALSRSLDSLLQPSKQTHFNDIAGFQSWVTGRRQGRRASSLELICLVSELEDSPKWLSKLRRDTLVLFKTFKGNLNIPGNHIDNRLTAKLRRDTLGNALDVHGYKRPLLESSLQETFVEEDEEEEENDCENEEENNIKDVNDRSNIPEGENYQVEEEKNSEDVKDEEDVDTDDEIINSKLNMKLRRDTLGLALKMRRVHIDSEEDEEDEDTNNMCCSEAALEGSKMVLNNHRLSVCSCASEVYSSSEDLEARLQCTMLCKLRRDTFGDALKSAVDYKVSSSFEDITELEIDQKKSSLNDRKSTWLNNMLMEGEHNVDTEIKSPEHNKSTKKVLFTDEELTSTLERIKSSSKVETKQPYTLVYASPKVPKGSIPEIIVQQPNETTKQCQDGSRKSSITDSLREFETSIYDMLQTGPDSSDDVAANSVAPNSVAPTQS